MVPGLGQKRRERFCTARLRAGPAGVSHREVANNRTEFDGESGKPKSKNPRQRRGFEISGARTRTKTPGAFLHSAFTRWPRRGEPQGGGEQSNGVRWRVRKAQKQKPAFWAGSLNKWCPDSESNQGHGDFQSPALPTELSGQRGALNRKGCGASTALS